MILNSQRQPDFSLYYLGGVLLKILEQVKVISIEKLLEESQQHLKKKVHVDFIYYGLDWLYLLELVRVEEGKVYYENKKLIVRKTKPSEEVIREIQFKEKGLNLIIDDTPESLRESGNSVGKSTAIKIIDLCLGAKSVRELYYDSDTRSENVVVKDFLEEYKVQAELILIDENKREYSIKRDLFLRGKKYILTSLILNRIFGMS